MNFRVILVSGLHRIPGELQGGFRWYLGGLRGLTCFQVTFRRGPKGFRVGSGGFKGVSEGKMRFHRFLGDLSGYFMGVSGSCRRFRAFPGVSEGSKGSTSTGFWVSSKEALNAFSRRFCMDFRGIRGHFREFHGPSGPWLKRASGGFKEIAEMFQGVSSGCKGISRRF